MPRDRSITDQPINQIELSEHDRTDVKQGLSSSEAKVRKAKYGANEIKVQEKQGAMFILSRQFQSSVVILLIVAALISLMFAEYTQAVAIFVAILINAGVGFFTELRAKISLEELAKLSSSTVRVRRNGQEVELATVDLVPGDIISLEPGIRVPADVILVDTCGLKVDESALTGESLPVLKALSSDSEDDEPNNAVFQGTLVIEGKAWSQVVATGLDSRVGQLGQLLTGVSSRRTPLEEKLEELGTQLSWLTLGICIVLAAIGIWHKEEILSMVQTSIALAVAAIPEGLPVVATLALAIGTQRMVRRGCLVRQLAAVETLGCCQIICTDKTGTLTENRMLVTEFAIDGRQFAVSGSGYEPLGEISENGQVVDIAAEETVLELLRAVVLCNDAILEHHSGCEDWHVHGDPTEGALIVAASKAGLKQTELQSQYPRIQEISFDLNRKRMTTVHKTAGGRLVAFTKGSPDHVFNLCSSIETTAGTVSLTEEQLNWFRSQNMSMARRGLRILAVAKRNLLADVGAIDASGIEHNLTLLGLIGMSDRPKLGVKEALDSCRKAGIRVVMLTGDQALTAHAIGKDLGIISADQVNEPVAIGSELKELTAAQLESVLDKATVLARISPEMKLSIVKALQGKGNVVAMTGDGVNDAPALRQADIGVVMGKSGADLARESAKLVITDDNFSTIVKAIEQGRVIYSNIQRAIAYLLTASLAAVFTVTGAVLADTGLPLLPLQLLWLNLIMHIFPALGIALLPSHKTMMRKLPRHPSKGLIGVNEQAQIFLRGLIVSIASLLAVVINANLAGHAFKLTTICFATLALSLLFQAWLWALSGRLLDHDGVRRSFTPTLVLNMLLSYLFLVAAIYVPPLSSILKTVALDFSDWLLVLAAALISLICSLVVDRFFARGNN